MPGAAAERVCAQRSVLLSPHITVSTDAPEVRPIEDMVTSPEYRHVPTGTLAVLAQRLGKVWASPSTWYRLVRQNGWRRPRLRVHPAKPKIGLRTTRASNSAVDSVAIRRANRCVFTGSSSLGPRCKLAVRLSRHGMRPMPGARTTRCR
jgi:hypothetical protein